MQIGLIGSRQHGPRARARLGRARAVHRLRLGPRRGARRRSSAARRWPPTRELAERADLVVLAHKPAQLDDGRRGDRRAPPRRRLDARRARRWRELRAAYPATPVVPHQAEHAGRAPARRARLRRARRRRATRPLARAVHELFGRARPRSSTVPEPLMRRRRRDSAASGPAYLALVAEAQVDAAVRRGLPAALAATLVTETMAGTAALLRARERRHAARCAARSPRPAARPPAASRRSSAAACAPPSRTRWTTWSTERDDARPRHGARRSPTSSSALIFVYALIIIAYIVVSWSSRSACACRTRAGSTRCWTSCATWSEPYLRIFRRLPRASARSTSARSWRSSCCSSSARILVGIIRG